MNKGEKYYGLTISRGEEHRVCTKLLDVAEKGQQQAMLSGNPSGASEFRQINHLLNVVRRVRKEGPTNVEIALEEIHGNGESAGVDNGALVIQKSTTSQICHNEKSTDGMTKSKKRRTNKKRSKDNDTAKCISKIVSQPCHKSPQDDTKQRPSTFAADEADQERDTDTQYNTTLIAISDPLVNTTTATRNSSDLSATEKATKHTQTNEDGHLELEAPHQGTQQSTSGKNRKKKWKLEGGSKKEVDHFLGGSMEEASHTRTDKPSMMDEPRISGVEFKNGSEKTVLNDNFACTKPSHKLSKSTTSAEIQRDRITPKEAAELMDNWKGDPPMSLEQSREQRGSIKAERRASINFIRARTVSRAATEDLPPIVQQLREQLNGTAADNASSLLDKAEEIPNRATEGEVEGWKTITTKGNRSHSTGKNKKGLQNSSGQANRVQKQSSSQQHRGQNQNQGHGRKNNRSKNSQASAKKATSATEKRKLNDLSADGKTDRKSGKKSDIAKVNIDSQIEFPTLPPVSSKALSVTSSTSDARQEPHAPPQDFHQAQIPKEIIFEAFKEDNFGSSGGKGESNYTGSQRQASDTGTLSVNKIQVDIDPIRAVNLPISSKKDGITDDEIDEIDEIDEHKAVEVTSYNTHINRLTSPAPECLEGYGTIEGENTSHSSPELATQPSTALRTDSADTDFDSSSHDRSAPNYTDGSNSGDECQTQIVDNNYSSGNGVTNDNSSESTLGRPMTDTESQVASEQHTYRNLDRSTTEPLRYETLLNGENQPIYASLGVDNSAAVPPQSQLHGAHLNDHYEQVYPNANGSAPGYEHQYASASIHDATPTPTNPAIADPRMNDQGQPNGPTVVNQFIYMQPAPPPPPLLLGHAPNFQPFNAVAGGVGVVGGTYHDQGMMGVYNNANAGPPLNPHNRIPQFCLRCGTQEYGCIYCTPGATGAHFPTAPPLTDHPGQHCYTCRNYINGCGNCLGRVSPFCYIPVVTVRNNAQASQVHPDNYEERSIRPGQGDDVVPPHSSPSDDNDNINYENLNVGASASVQHAEATVSSPPLPPPVLGSHTYTWSLTDGSYNFNDFTPYSYGSRLHNNNGADGISEDAGGSPSGSTTIAAHQNE
ncbi:hypothetical protein F5884DRAFT_283942 [Xylogone sp. PMI_703]|nr:hypothetical protein F5884DRAFT_283942 [Xylogone sp. PMI_703]